MIVGAVEGILGDACCRAEGWYVVGGEIREEREKKERSKERREREENRENKEREI